MILKLYFEEVLGYNDFLYQLKDKKEEEIIFKKVNDNHTIFIYCNNITDFYSNQLYEYFSFLDLESVRISKVSGEIYITWIGETIFKFTVIITQIPCYIPARGKGSESLLYTLAAIDILTKETEEIKEPVSNKIKDVKFNDPATIVFWEDGTKTVVKVQDGEKFDKEKGLAMAIIKKSQDNSSKYYEIFKKYIKD